MSLHKATARLHQIATGAFLSSVVLLNLVLRPDYSGWKIIFKTLSIVQLLPVCGLLIAYGTYQLLDIGAKAV